MIDNETIGVGIITHNRPEQLLTLVHSLPKKLIDQLVIVNDGNDNYAMKELGDVVIHTDGKIGVGKSKNIALNQLSNYDHVFLIEDDIFIKDFKVFQKYIDASKISGIQHFNFSQHGMMNKAWPSGSPNPRTTVDYNGERISLYPHCVGAFSYYSRKCLDEVGFLCEDYYNACEHVDHTLEIIKAGMHPPFWYFADIANSEQYIGDETWSINQSEISSRVDHKEIVSAADRIFFKRHGMYPGQIPDTDIDNLTLLLKQIKKKYV